MSIKQLGALPVLLKVVVVLTALISPPPTTKFIEAHGDSFVCRLSTTSSHLGIDVLVHITTINLVVM